MKRGRKQVLKNGDEYDAVFKAPLCVFENITGLRKFTKKVLNRRLRREEKNKLRFSEYKEF